MAQKDVHIECHFLHYVCSGDGCSEVQFPASELLKHIQQNHHHRLIALSMNGNPLPQDIVEQMGVAFQALAEIPTPPGSFPLLDFEYYLGSHYIHCRSPSCAANPRIQLVDLGAHIHKAHPLPAANIAVRTHKGFLISNALKRDIIDLGNYYTGGLSRAAAANRPAPIVQPPPQPTNPASNLASSAQPKEEDRSHRPSGTLKYLLNPTEIPDPVVKSESSESITEARAADNTATRSDKSGPTSAAELETASILMGFKDKSQS